MSRLGISLLVCAGSLLGALPLLPAAPDDEAVRKKTFLIAVQHALVNAREHLKNGHYKAAVDILEREMNPEFNVQENREYTRALAEAYIGLIAELKRNNQLDEIKVYQTRLGFVEPTALLEPRINTVASRVLPPPTVAPSAAAPVPLAAQAIVSAPTTNPALAAPAAPTIRAQMGQDELTGDPFDDSNRRETPGARALLKQAEREFEATHYVSAAGLYEQAEKAQSGIISEDARKRWGYCKLSKVITDLNSQQAAPQELEREIRLAQTMAPMLKDLGGQLLQRVQERQQVSTPTPKVREAAEEKAVAVKHTPRQGNSWAMAETANFRVYHLLAQEKAEKLIQTAESTRLIAARKWFGEALEKWPDKCDIYVYATGDDYSKHTGQPRDCPGHSRMPMDGGRVLERSIHVHADNGNMLIGVIPHEVTHVVLAGKFPRVVPRWADEGMAVLSEPRDRINLHLRNLPMHAQKRQLFAAEQLMKLDEYPEPQRMGAFYAQSVSLVDYLSKQRGPKVFADFLSDGLRSGYEAALRKHYELNSFADLDKAWQKYALEGESAASLKR